MSTTELKKSDVNADLLAISEAMERKSVVTPLDVRLALMDYADKNIPLYLCNCKKKDVNYNSTNLMMEKNVKFLYDTTTNVALAKLYVAYNFINENQIQEFLNTCIAGEFMTN